MLLVFLEKEEGGVMEVAKVEKVGEVFRCGICGNVVEVKEVGGGELVCCGQPMVKEELVSKPRR